MSKPRSKKSLAWNDTIRRHAYHPASKVFTSPEVDRFAIDEEEQEAKDEKD
jgi:hypothetical protein